jgi:hypothetical protein
MRCGKTPASDGVTDGVHYTPDDHFCLDGMPLVAVNGPYGANGTEYRTENDSFSKITSSTLSTEISIGPQSFEVRTKSGELWHYVGKKAHRIRTNNGSLR